MTKNYYKELAITFGGCRRIKTEPIGPNLLHLVMIYKNSEKCLNYASNEQKSPKNQKNDMSGSNI